MKQLSTILVLIALVSFTALARAGEDSEIMDKVTEGVCNCLEKSKKDNTPIQSKEFQNCLQKSSKVYVKQLKKMYDELDDPMSDKKLLSVLAMQLAASMGEKCPDMMEFILEEFPELLDDN